jgi:hypothetical protein
LCIFLHSAVTSSILGPNVLLSTLFSNTLSPCCSLSVRDQVSHPYKTTGRVHITRNKTRNGWDFRFSRRQVWRWLLLGCAPCTRAEFYRRFRGSCCYIIGALSAASTSEISVKLYQAKRGNNPELSHPRKWYWRQRCIVCGYSEYELGIGRDILFKLKRLSQQNGGVCLFVCLLNKCEATEVWIGTWHWSRQWWGELISYCVLNAAQKRGRRVSYLFISKVWLVIIVFAECVELTFLKERVAN